MTSDGIDLRPFTDVDTAWLKALAERRWGGTLMVSRGRTHDLRRLPGIVAEVSGAPAGLATYAVENGECELVSLDSLRPGAGAGAALLDAVAAKARARGCARLWLITTNDNTRALRFYQRHGLDLVALHRDAVTATRAIKPTLPAYGEDGIPIRHELELELRL